MKHSEASRPQRLLLSFFRWFCHPSYREEIEGGLLEHFQLNAEKNGAARASRLFFLDVLRLFRPEIILYFHFLILKFLKMKTAHWLKFLALNLHFALFVILPFPPGPPNKIAIGLSALAQFASFFGLLLLLLVSLIWVVLEFKRHQGKTRDKITNWSGGYYLALLVTIISLLIYILLTVGFYMEEGWWVVGVNALLLLLVLWKIIPGIKKLRQQNTSQFNPTPLYLLSIPVISVISRIFLMEPVADISRAKAIRQCQPLITAIEN